MPGMTHRDRQNVLGRPGRADRFGAPVRLVNRACWPVQLVRFYRHRALCGSRAGLIVQRFVADGLHVPGPGRHWRGIPGICACRSGPAARWPRRRRPADSRAALGAWAIHIGDPVTGDQDLGPVRVILANLRYHVVEPYLDQARRPRRRGPGAGALPPAWGPGSARAGPHRKNDADLAGRRPGQVAHPAGDVDRMIAEPVIEPRYQRHLDRHRGLHPA